MYYEYSITITTDSTKQNPIEEECLLGLGTLRLVTLHFPAGVHRVANISIWRWGRQILPNYENSYISSDDMTVRFDEYLPILEMPYLVTIKGWNNGGSYIHTIKVGFLILPFTRLSSPGDTGLYEIISSELLESI